MSARLVALLSLVSLFGAPSAVLAQGPIRLLDEPTGAQVTGASGFARAGGRVYFTAEVDGRVALWQTNGTAEGTRAVAEGAGLRLVDRFDAERLVVGPTGQWPDAILLEDGDPPTLQPLAVPTDEQVFDGGGALVAVAGRRLLLRRQSAPALAEHPDRSIRLLVEEVRPDGVVRLLQHWTDGAGLLAPTPVWVEGATLITRTADCRTLTVDGEALRIAETIGTPPCPIGPIARLGSDRLVAREDGLWLWPGGDAQAEVALLDAAIDRLPRLDGFGLDGGPVAPAVALLPGPGGFWLTAGEGPFSLWWTDGTPAGTTPIADRFSPEAGLVQDGEALLFVALDETGSALRRHRPGDGVEALLPLGLESESGLRGVYGLTALPGLLVFAASEEDAGPGLYALPYTFAPPPTDGGCDGCAAAPDRAPSPGALALLALLACRPRRRRRRAQARRRPWMPPRGRFG